MSEAAPVGDLSAANGNIKIWDALCDFHRSGLLDGYLRAFFQRLQISARRAVSVQAWSRSHSQLWFLLAVLLLVAAWPGRSALAQERERNPIPILAYYYIWFEPSMWNRAKVDYPLLGRYSSDDQEIMQQHVRWAKGAGIDGFIVSWKSSEKLDRRLEQLIEIAGNEDFKLSIIYQGLDFERRPLPVDRIAEDLEYFTEEYASSEFFDTLGLPVVIWSGSWKFSRSEVAQVTSAFRDRLLILASEKNVDGYQRLADLVDGNAYYWSSVNPETFPGYQEKLDTMGQAVHANGGLWIAPAAPGFDARLVGGTRVVERQDGDTLRSQMDAAMKSSPDAVGLISWNEFSENTHIEPSENFGTRYLEVIAHIRSGVAPEILNFESSEPAETQSVPGRGREVAFVAMAILIVGSLAAIAWRSRSV